MSAMPMSAGRATREGYCYQRVQAIIVAIDQYAEKDARQPGIFLEKNRMALEVEGTITFPDSYRSKRERKLSVAGTTE
jgi:hypothetical protein